MWLNRISLIRSMWACRLRPKVPCGPVRGTLTPEHARTMDISALKEQTKHDDTPHPVEITGRDGNPLPAPDGSACTISVFGSESQVYRREKEAISRAFLQRRQTKIEPQDLLNNRIRAAAAAVASWHGFESNGQPAPCTPTNVRAVLAHEWILEQVEQGIEAHASFFTNSSASSSSTSAGTPTSAA